MCRNKQESYELQIPVSILKERAKTLFWNMSGFSVKNPPSEYQKKEVLQLQQALESKIEINALLRKLEPYSFEKQYMTLADGMIYYDLPLHLYKEQIVGIYAFLISEDTLVSDEQDTVDQLYTHIWQNAYLDAAREWVKEYLFQKTGQFVSSCISPGFYGIALSHMKTLYHMVDGEKIGVSVRPDGLLYPEKSVLGIYLLLKNQINILGKRCGSCPAQGKNCEFCMEKI